MATFYVYCSDNTKPDDLRKVLDPFGKVSVINMLANGLALAVIKLNDENVDVISAVNGTEVNGEKIRIQKAIVSDGDRRSVSNSAAPSSRIKLFIGNCADDANAEDLKSVFSRFGRVMEAEVINGKGFGFVHLETQNQADAAIASLNGTDVKGRKIRVELATGGRGRGSGVGPSRGGGGGFRRGGGGGGPYSGGPRNYGGSGRQGGGYGDRQGGGSYRRENLDRGGSKEDPKEGGEIRDLHSEIAKIKHEQESLARNQKRNGSFIHGWPEDVCPFTNQDIASACAKVEIVKKFFAEVLKMPPNLINEVDIVNVFVSKEKQNRFVVINFVRETDKENVNPFLKNLGPFNRDRNTPVVWRDDQTKQQMLKKIEMRAAGMFSNRSRN